MAKRGLVVDIAEMICPDKWQYQYDGKTFTAIEEFSNNISREELEGIRDRWIRGSGEASLEGNKLTVRKDVMQHYAVSNLAIEGALQASVLKVISRDTQYGVIADALEGVAKIDGKKSKGGKG